MEKITFPSARMTCRLMEHSFFFSPPSSFLDLVQQDTLDGKPLLTLHPFFPSRSSPTSIHHWRAMCDRVSFPPSTTLWRNGSWRKDFWHLRAEGRVVPFSLGQAHPDIAVPPLTLYLERSGSASDAGHTFSSLLKKCLSCHTTKDVKCLPCPLVTSPRI